MYAPRSPLTHYVTTPVALPNNPNHEFQFQMVSLNNSSNSNGNRSLEGSPPSHSSSPRLPSSHTHLDKKDTITSSAPPPTFSSNEIPQIKRQFLSADPPMLLSVGPSESGSPDDPLDASLLRQRSADKWTEEDMQNHKKELENQIQRISMRNVLGIPSSNTGHIERAESAPVPRENHNNNKKEKIKRKSSSKSKKGQFLSVKDPYDDDSSNSNDESDGGGMHSLERTDSSLLRQRSADKWTEEEMENHKKEMEIQMKMMAMHNSLRTPGSYGE